MWEHAQAASHNEGQTGPSTRPRQLRNRERFKERKLRVKADEPTAGIHLPFNLVPDGFRSVLNLAVPDSRLQIDQRFVIAAQLEHARILLR